MNKPGFTIRILLVLSLTTGNAALAQTALPPGTVIEKSQQEKIFLGAPSLVVLPNGDYLSSHHLTGPAAPSEGGGLTRIHVSTDKGRHWSLRSEIRGQFWSSLFLHRGALYIIGTAGGVSDIVIRRSTDQGRTWTTPSDASNGRLLRKQGNMGYHCAPVPVLLHKGRLWRAFEYTADKGWGNFSAVMLSIDEKDDLLDATKWTVSNKLTFDRGNQASYSSWLEGNAVATPDGKVIDLLRVHHKEDDIAARVHVSALGDSLRFDPASDFLSLPGAGKKFTIHYDQKSGRYWSLTNYAPQQEKEKAARLGHTLERTRNTLVLISSGDLRTWDRHLTVLYSPEILKHGFQYADWKFDGKDIEFPVGNLEARLPVCRLEIRRQGHRISSRKS